MREEGQNHLPHGVEGALAREVADDGRGLQRRSMRVRVLCARVLLPEGGLQVEVGEKARWARAPDATLPWRAGSRPG